MLQGSRASSICSWVTRPQGSESVGPVPLRAAVVFSYTSSRMVLIRKLKTALGGRVKSFNFGPTQARRIGIVTGAAGSEIYRVADEKIDTVITGEAPHWAAVAAEELGVNLLLGGHYATETFGVKALAAILSEKFKLPWEFLNFPTGL